MKRLYTRRDYLAKINKARAWIPEITFSSDFIVGFPGETEEDFQLTLEAVRGVQYDQVFSFKYSERPGTPAARLRDNVSLLEKKRRLAELMAVQEEVWSVMARRQVGDVWQGWVEAPARRPPGAWRARTANNRKVLLEEPALAPGERVVFRVTGFQHTTFLGDLVREPL
jgi:tRNA-2-methylthio-N6-dimethylallyladenosine synthase